VVFVLLKNYRKSTNYYNKSIILTLDIAYFGKWNIIQINTKYFMWRYVNE